MSFYDFRLLELLIERLSFFFGLLAGVAMEDASQKALCADQGLRRHAGQTDGTGGCFPEHIFILKDTVRDMKCHSLFCRDRF